MIISLGAPLPVCSCSLPGTQGQRAAPHPSEDGYYPCLALLQMGVAWPWYYYQRRWSLKPPFHHRRQSLPAGRGCLGSLFLWPDPANFSTPGVTRHLALWSADFPRAGKPARDHPTGLRTYSVPHASRCVKHNLKFLMRKPGKKSQIFVYTRGNNSQRGTPCVNRLLPVTGR
jgi:hypothetical protein